MLCGLFNLHVLEFDDVGAEEPVSAGRDFLVREVEVVGRSSLNSN